MLVERFRVVVEQALHILPRRGGGRGFPAKNRGQKIAVQFGVAAVGDGFLE